MSNIGNNTRSERNLNGWTQIQLADKSGLTLSAVCRIELRNDASVSEIEALARVFRLEPNVLTGWRMDSIIVRHAGYKVKPHTPKGKR